LKYNYLTRRANCTASNLLQNMVRFSKCSHKSSLNTECIQLAFSLHSVSVSYFCNIHSHRYECSHCGPLKRNQWNTNCSWHFSIHPAPRLQLMVAMNTVACGARSGLFLRYCSWHGSVAVCTGRQMASKAYAASASQIMYDFKCEGKDLDSIQAGKEFCLHHYRTWGGLENIHSTFLVTRHRPMLISV